LVYTLNVAFTSFVENPDAAKDVYNRVKTINGIPNATLPT
jgi:hypothetical protein